MFPLAVVCGNTFLLKPSERVPGTSMAMMRLLRETGLPAGVVNCVNGDKLVVDQFIEDERVKSISFVGSNKVGEYIYREGSRRGKRVQCNMGAKNHCVVIPDADRESTVNQIVGAAFGASGQRCMALTTVVLVGESQE